MNAMWLTLVLMLLLQGCATNMPLHRDPYKSAVVDVVTTAAVLGKGGTELNPIGFPATNVGKAALLFYVRPRLSEEGKKAFDRWGASVWWGASVNNILQFLIPSNVYISATMGIATGIYIYNVEDPKPEDK